MIAASLWHIRWWEALGYPLLVVMLVLAGCAVSSERARRNRAVLRRQRRSERALVRRLRTW